MSSLEEIKKIYSKYTLAVYPRNPAIALDKGNGVKVWDSEGREYLDFSSGIGVTNLGHAHPRLNEVAKNQIDKLIHTSNQFYNESHALLAKKLCELSGFDKIFLSNSGAEANECAIKIVRKWGAERGKSEIIHFDNSFHGRTLGTISATSEKKSRSGFEPLLDGFLGVPAYDLSAIKRVAGEKTAAIILECIVARSGVILPPAGFMGELRDLADSVGFLIILDEMQSGIGRTGKLFGYQHEAMRPDILAIAKGLANGFPIGATLTTDKVANVMTTGSHGTTFGGNPLSARVAHAVLELVSEEALLTNVKDRGNELLVALQKLAEKFPKVIKSVRGRGLMIGAELCVPSQEFLSKLVDQGVICISGGPDSIRVYPPLIVTKQEVQMALGHFEAALNTYQGG